MTDNKEKNHQDYSDWYNLCMQQSKEFFSSADENLKNFFATDGYLNPEDNLKKITEWLNTLKNQWSFLQFPDDQDGNAIYWKNMNKMCHEASDLMVEQWVKRTRSQRPIRNVHELYQLWLECCQEVYQRSLQTNASPEKYGELMNAAFYFWKNNMPQ
ncbi:MAG: hypothetical protein H0W64_06740 [Gammaproteobacteria bacterium]|nr:hypothetical protein [Gammaproteobacteria bacterium]